MTRLSVNINKVATIRNARGGNNPDVLRVAQDCERFGAQGITVHPRPDQRHIRYQDVRDLRPLLTTEFNIEGNPISEFIALVLENRPTQVTLVPDGHDQITSNHGWDTKTHLNFLTDVTARFHEAGIRVSIFVNADEEMVDYAARAGADRVELYTEPYAEAYASALALAGSPSSSATLPPSSSVQTVVPEGFPEGSPACAAAIAPFVRAAKAAQAFGLGLNAGHDLNLHNLAFFKQQIPFVNSILNMVYLFFATGTEEIEALGTADIIRRAGLDLQIISITGERTVTGAHGIRVETDDLLENVDFFDADMLIFPGGLPGATNLAACSDLNERLRDHVYLGRPVAAICAAPLVLGRLGLLDGKRATCYPGFEGELTGATCTGALVEVDGQFITGKGPAAVFEFGYAIVARLKDQATAEALAKGMLWSEVR